MTADLSAAVLEAAARRPQAPAVVAGGRAIDYGAFARAVLGTAAAIQEAGVRPGEAAALLVTDTPRDVIALFALFRLGVPFIVTAPQESAAERRRLIERIGARVTIGPAAHAADEGIAGESARYLALERLLSSARPARPLPVPDPEAIAYFNRSSGTTQGRVKLIGITHAQQDQREATLATAFPRGTDDRHLHLMTLANAFARSAVTGTLRSGGTVVFAPPMTRVGDIREVVRTLGITAAALSPPYVRDILRRAAAEPALPGIRLLLGTAPLTPAELLGVLDRITPLAHVGYSTNEVGYLALAGPADLAAAIGSVGRALPGIQAQVVDGRGRPVPPDTIGALRFRHPAFPSAYVDPAPGSTSRFHGGWFYPGDAGTIAADGRITLKGRIDDVINVGGRKVHPTAIEGWLRDHPDVAEVAVMAVGAARTGQVPVAAVVLARPAAEADLLAFCRARGASLPMPGRVIGVPAIPRNAAGKVDRRALAALLTPALTGRRDEPPALR